MRWIGVKQGRYLSEWSSSVPNLHANEFKEEEMKFTRGKILLHASKYFFPCEVAVWGFGLMCDAHTRKVWGTSALLKQSKLCKAHPVIPTLRHKVGS